MNAKTKTSRRPSAQDKLLEAALTVIRQKGYAATTVDDLCAAAGVTKGAFFHHFTSKEDLGVAAANYWSEMTGALFAAAPYHAPEDPFDRVLAYIDFRAELLAGELHEFTCLVGTMVQEVYGSSDPIREACRASIEGHAQTLEADIAAAVNEHGVAGDFTPKSLALHTQAVLQGAFILAKATGDVRVAEEMVGHLRRYIELLFSSAKGEKQ